MIEKSATTTFEKPLNATNGTPKRHKGDKFLNRKRSSMLFYILIMLLPIVQFVLMYICVNINSIFLAFKEYTTEGTYIWLEQPFQNFQEVFKDITDSKTFGYALENSLILCVCTLLINIPLSLFFSYYIFKGFPGNKFYRIVLYLPNIVSSIVMVTIFNYIFENAIPELSVLLFGGKEPNGLISDPNTSLACLIAFNVLFSFGSITMVFSSSMSSINTSVIEAATLDGCDRLQEFIYVIFPLTFNVIKLQLIAALVGIFTNQLNLYAFFDVYADPSLYTIGYYLYRGTLSSGPSGYPYYAAMGVVLTFVAVPIILGIRQLFDRFDPYTDKGRA